MLQIHQLRQLTPKAAELESIYIVRRLREKGSLPLTEQHMQEETAEFVISPTDLEAMEQAQSLLEPTIKTLQGLLQERNPFHEPANLQRAVQILKEASQPLQQNAAFLRQQMEFLSTAAPFMASILNSLATARTAGEKQVINENLNNLFSRLLRSSNFTFRHDDLVHEAQLSHVVGLKESMEKGFLFHVSLEEELKKLPYAVIQRRLPQEKIVEAAWLAENISVISKGVEKGYDANMRLINIALIWYAHVKWIVSRNIS